EWYPKPELVETRTLRWIRAGRIKNECGAEIFGILNRIIGRVEKIRGALRTSPRLFTGGKSRKNHPFFGGKPILRPRAWLLRLGRFGMVIKSAMLVVRNQDDRVAPVGSITHRIDQLRHERLATLNVGGRMLVVFELRSQKPKVRVHE